MLREGEGLAAKALGSFRVSLDATRDRVREVVGQGTASPSEHLTVTSRFKNVLQLALREALELGASVIGTEHILLGLIREGGGVGAEVLGREGISLPELRQRVMELISTTSGGDAPSPEPVGAGGWSAGRAHQLDDVGTNLTRLAAEGTIDAASILKPMLARGELQTIGATTLGEYRKHVEKDAPLERRF